MAAIKRLFKMRWTKLTPAAGTRTGRSWSLISKAENEVETPRLWAVCSITISQWLKMRKAKRKTHSDASNLCAWIPIRVTSRNGWHEISGASACRCRSCWSRHMHWTPRRFLGFEKKILRSALHIKVNERERSLYYISGVTARSHIIAANLILSTFT